MSVRILVLAVAVVLVWPSPGRAENVLRWASAISGVTFDPHAFNHQPTRAQNMQVYEPLVDFDSDHSIRPSLAVAWRPVDSTTWEFELRQGVRFHNGAPMSAADVVFSLTRALSPKSEFGRDVPPVAAIEADGNHIVRVQTVQPNPILPEQLFSIGIMSKAWAERHGAVEVAPYTDAEIAYVENHANGTGPFVLEAYEPGARTVLVRNANWWGLAKDGHNIDRVVFTAVADPGERMSALLAGEIDFLHDPPFADLDRLAATPGVRLEQAMEFRTIFFGLNQGGAELYSSNIKGKNPFADLRVRRAVYQAIDIDAIQHDIMRGYAMPAGMIIQPGINGYTPEFDARLPHDPDAAKALLAEAGYRDGFEVRLDCPKDRYLNDESICRAVAGMLAKVGITVDLAMAPMGEHIATLRERRTDFYMLGWGTQTFDSHNHFVYLYRSDGQYAATGYANPRVDELIDAIGAELVTYGRDAMIEEVWRTVLADVVVVPLHHQVMVWALRDRLELPVDALDLPRFRLARIKSPAEGVSPSEATPPQRSEASFPREQRPVASEPARASP
jgi:peptide/nickel transport system substrate-binding protein